jgi:hypothetical protein
MVDVGAGETRGMGELPLREAATLAIVRDERAEVVVSATLRARQVGGVWFLKKRSHVAPPVRPRDSG